ncbi:MAG TPA: isoleucine--tRNA ligase, partial [Candidatus Nanopelagicaceae bacterium]|nr:isoleucine--tRNA ligase [Candidatus Nanopelagicaceae bacterium]
AEFPVLPPQLDLPALERGILEFWDRDGIFHQSMAATEIGPNWTFYEGPPTANGLPGTHHVEARVFKDLFPRFQTMKGSYVLRKAGWDCHGLPVELAVEKELGFTGKQDIEAYGVAEFNAKCRESVQRHVGEFEAMTRRMGFWVDFDQAYWTMSPQYVESVWWSLKEIWQKGLLVEDHRVAPYCPRCGTTLSDHELAQGYETVVDPSVYVRFPITSGPLVELGAALLVWTTTPWTLVSNTAVAVKPDVHYVAARTSDGEVLVVAKALIEVLGDNVEILHEFLGHELEHVSYTRPFDLIEIPEAHYVVLADYVTTEDGTGLVHQSPAFGADDLAVARVYGMPVVNPIEPNGTFESSVPLVGGQFFKDADKILVKDLKTRGRLFKEQAYEHSYPHCWRCHTALLYYAQPSWYIRTTAIKDALIRENQKTDWHPSTIKTGRYGDWLENNIDWALSRKRYWGTPLPIWRCDNDHTICVGSLRELGALAGLDLLELDPHRPYVDDISFDCADCGHKMNRVSEVIDGWYDSGAMPFAQWGYPHVPGSVEKFSAAFPADFICEAIDQTRGWFYTLMAIGTLVFDQSSYKTVLCLGHILDKDGRKMSKHLGNVLEPIQLMDKHGADAVRWFMLASGSPWQSRRVGHEAIADVVRKTLLTYWNTVAFHSLYAGLSEFSAVAKAPEAAERPVLDRWALSELNRTIKEVDQAYTEFDSQAAGRLISQFVDNLSNWYVRRSRRRFWNGDTSALATLHECLRSITLLMAPMVPFITEHAWQELFILVDPEQPSSVHLAPFPVADEALIDSVLQEQVSLVRRLVELGRAARAESQVKIRQPLGRALISASGWQQIPADLRAQISEELNVSVLDDISAAGADLVDISIKANFRTLGQRFGNQTQDLAAAIAKSDANSLVEGLRINGTALVGLNGMELEITVEDLVITETPKSGWAVVSGGGESVALDLTITPELRRAGIMREIVRLIQEGRKSAGFDVSDRIKVLWSADGQTLEAIQEHENAIKEEILAIDFARSQTALTDGLRDEENGFACTIERA